MNVGILTWYDVLNYGSVFQAYALQEQIKNLGNSVEILRHDRILPSYYSNKMGGKGILSVFRWIRNQTPGRVRYRSETKKKYEAFEDFRKEYLNIDEHYSNSNNDVVIIGSDQVFDINGMYYPFQFGQGIQCMNIGTYAPSFGETTLESLKQSEHFIEIVNSIRKIGVVNARDINTETILADIRKHAIDIVIDPVLLYPFIAEKKMWNERLIKDKYCIVYTWGGYTTNKLFSEKCSRFAKANSLKLVSVGEYRPWCDIQYSAASPIEFFELFMHADMVLTNMFHGTCFSIIMQRPFYSFVMPHNENKLGYLLKSLNADSQILVSPDQLGTEMPSIDYHTINQILNEKRHFSNQCLIKAINNN